MESYELLLMSLLLLLLVITTFLAFGTSIWLNKQCPFSKLDNNKIDELSNTTIDLTYYNRKTIKEISEIEKCGKKIIITQFIDKQINNYSRRAWEDYIKAWMGMSIIALVILCSQIKAFPKNITLPEILHTCFNTFISTLIFYGLFIYIFKLFFEFWLLKSQVHDNEEVLD